MSHRRPSQHSDHTQLLDSKTLRDVVLRMHEAFPRVCKQWNVTSCMRKNWATLFEHMDTDGSGRLHFSEFVEAVGALGVEGISARELDAFWRYVDHDGSGEVTVDEFQHSCYLLLVEGWPTYDETIEEDAAELSRLVKRIDDAAEHEYSTMSGNWFKIFQHVDVDASGRLGYEELEAVLRTRDPGLNVSRSDLADDELRGMWKCIDDDRSGDVTVEEFLTFMRKFGPSMHRLTNYALEKRGLEKRAAWRNPKLKEKKVKEKKSAMERLAHFKSASSRGEAPLEDERSDASGSRDGGRSGRGAASAESSPAVPRARRSGRAVQLAHLQWRKRVNESKIRDALEGKTRSAERDFIRRFALNSTDEQANWRAAIITDELAGPLAVDNAALNRYEETSARTREQEAAEARRHASSLIWLERRIKQREASIVEDAMLFGKTPSLDSPSTLGLMRGSFADLKSKIESYGADRFGPVDGRLANCPAWGRSKTHRGGVIY